LAKGAKAGHADAGGDDGAGDYRHYRVEEAMRKKLRGDGVKAPGARKPRKAARTTPGAGKTKNGSHLEAHGAPPPPAGVLSSSDAAEVASQIEIIEEDDLIRDALAPVVAKYGRSKVRRVLDGFSFSRGKIRSERSMATLMAFVDELRDALKVSVTEACRQLALRGTRRDGRPGGFPIHMETTTANSSSTRWLATGDQIRQLYYQAKKRAIHDVDFREEVGGKRSLIRHLASAEDLPTEEWIKRRAMAFRDYES
jgi:hypothetical protein